MKVPPLTKLFVFGGAYGNLEATETVLEIAKSKGFEKHEIVFTGDSIAYCANPLETALLIKNSGIQAIAGNCETAIAQGLADCGCGFNAGTECDLLSQQWYAFCSSQMNNEAKEWMRSLPSELEFSLGKFHLLCTHASLISNNEFVFASNVHEKTADYLASRHFDGMIVGHSGIPFVQSVHGKLWLNSGAAGMPGNDGTSRCWYATIRIEHNSLRAEIHPFEYNLTGAIEAMTQNGLANGYRDCLTTGIWPSHDVLPLKERTQTGQPLLGQTLHMTKEPVAELT